MSNRSTNSPLHLLAEVTANECIARDTFRMRMRQPAIAERILPGQFLMIRTPGRTDPLLARPIALYDVSADRTELEVVYLVLGNGTRCMSLLRAGASVQVFGPLGNTFPTQVRRKLLLVAGGIGQTPFLAVVREFRGDQHYGAVLRPIQPPEEITLVYGARSAEYFAGIADFTEQGVRVLHATNDGSAGRRGYVTELAAELLEDAVAAEETTVFGCGPEPMLAALASLAEKLQTPCWTSLESKMACGYGVCFSCVCPMNEATGWDYRRTCVEGPIFPAEAVAWRHM